MNDQVLTELRVVVERVVRPVRVSDVRKHRMREELLDHLTAVYEEEFDRSRNETTALSQAKERFGTPGGLTDELRQSVSRLEFSGYMADLYRYRPGESLLRYGFRHLLVAFLTMTCMGLILLPLTWIRGRIGEIGTLLHILFVTALFSAWFSFSFTFIAEQMGQVLYGRGSSRPVRSMIGYSLLSLLVLPLMAALTYGGLMLKADVALKGLLLGCLVAPAAPVIFYMMARQMKEQISQESEWLKIEIDK